MANGEKATEGGVTVEAIPAYDIIQGAPEHPKGKSNGYVITLGGTRIYVAGVTECVPEVRALKNIDVAFVPLNVPLGRMTPAAAAECVKAIAPKIVYPYHYDQVLAARLGEPERDAEGPAGGLTIAQSLQAFKDALEGREDRGARRRTGIRSPDRSAKALRHSGAAPGFRFPCGAGLQPCAYRTMTIGARQKAIFCAGGSITVTWQS